EVRVDNARHPSMKLHQGSGPVQDNEYVIVDLTGSVTRSPCPYTCADRGLSQDQCRAWQSSQDASECYVRDLRIASDAFPSLDNDRTVMNTQTRQQRARMRNPQQEQAVSATPETETLPAIYDLDIRLSQRGEQSELVRKAASTLAAFTGEKNLVTEEQLNRAKCVAVFPDVTQAAAVIGGRHGDGVTTCRNDRNQWSSLGFVDLYGMSIGAQAGATGSDLVVLFLSDNAERRLRNGKIDFSADAQAVLANNSAEVNRMLNDADIISIAEPQGLFAGASLSGTVISADTDELQAFYRENASFDRTITTYSFPNLPLIVHDKVQLQPAG
ncbi:MAG: lipid-binding SYLF domain-containing protein, partial [Bdellovibrionales bacterium]|nr:lipid-binding SYLF domain-containing protein [Bdellovibrionales bacterium]